MTYKYITELSATTPKARALEELGPYFDHGSATGHARGRPIGTPKKLTFFAVARNFVCTPETVFPDQKTTMSLPHAGHCRAWRTAQGAPPAAGGGAAQRRTAPGAAPATVGGTAVRRTAPGGLASASRLTPGPAAPAVRVCIACLAIFDWPPTVHFVFVLYSQQLPAL